MTMIGLASGVAALMAVLPFKGKASADALAALELREAAVAGSFYPADAHELATMVDGLLDEAARQMPLPAGELVALVAPHAGYVYSGATAARAYAAVRGKNFARVVVLAPSHYEAFSFSSIYGGDGYTTPLGVVPVDRVFARALAAVGGSLQLSTHGHAPTKAGAEHAVEVQLPLLQRALGEFTLVPIVMGDQSYAASRDLGVALASELAADGQPTLIVASSDLSHYHRAEEARRMDAQLLGAIAAWDYYNLSRNCEGRHWEACGAAPIAAAMIAAERLGARRSCLLGATNSGEVAGDTSRVVGYAAAALVKSSTDEPESAFALTAEEKRALLELARHSVEHAVRAGEAFTPLGDWTAALEQERGAFVTLHKAGQLRGCIGYIAPTKPLYFTVRDTATLAALRDPRFSPVEVAELADLRYEISVLSPLRRATAVEQIEVGRHGLLLKNGSHEGLLLPQVPVEQGWDRSTFLEQTCVKAGLERNAWKSDETDIFLFTAVVFSED